MGRTPGSLKLSSNMEINAGAPIDARSIVPHETDLVGANTFQFSYIGMLVAAQDTHKLFMLKDKPTTVTNNWVEIGATDLSNYYTKTEVDELVSRVYKPAGTVAFASLPLLDASVLGNVYDVSDAFTTDNRFAEGAGKKYPAGSNVAVIDLGVDPAHDYKFDVLPGFIDLSGYQLKMQVSTLPTASNDEIGNIYQYIGSTTVNYINGHFYICKEDASTTPSTYYWEEKEIQTVEDEIIKGYYNEDNGSFYEDITTAAPIAGEENKLYIALNNNNSYHWNGLEFVRLDEDPCIQVGIMPVASGSELHNIYQYAGPSNTDFVNGYFYECVEDTDNPGNYIWVTKEVQPGSDTGTLKNPITASITVGGINVGTTYGAGTDMEQLWNELLDPTLYPTLTGPSATLSVSGTKLIESGGTANRTFTLTLNRGSIDPAYGTSGYRSGSASTYSINGGTAGSTNTFAEIVSETNKTFQGTITYAAGEQPKDSKGHDYDLPLSAGSVNSNTITYEFVDALYANTANITSVAKLALVSKSAGVQQFNFPAQTIANPEEFHVPASWNVTAVEVLNTLSNQWEDCSGEFTTGTTTHVNAGGDSVNYVTYVDNRGYAAAARKVRVKWS